jgi:hypothetical protein
MWLVNLSSETEFNVSGEGTVTLGWGYKEFSGARTISNPRAGAAETAADQMCVCVHKSGEQPDVVRLYNMPKQ